MNLRNLEIASIRRIIAHTIHSKTKTVDAYAKHSDKMLTFSSAETRMLIDRLHEVLGNGKKTFRLEFEDVSPDSISANLSKVNSMSDLQFIEYSQTLADELAISHFRTKIPGGYCLIGEGETENNEHFFFTLKAELQEVFSIKGSALQLIKDVFLSPAKEFYKIGFFIRKGTGYIPFMFDDQFSLQKKDLTEYFYGKFLGLTTDRNDSLRSKNFYSDTKDFIESNVSNTKDRLGLLKALLVLYREETSGILSPRDFSEKYFEGKLKEKFDLMVDKYYPHSFTKNTTLIDRKLELQRFSIPLSYSLTIVGSSDSLEEIEIIREPTEEIIESLGPEINNGVIREMVLVREKAKSIVES